MTIEFKLPDIGEGIAEGEIVQWLVGEGDSVAEHQPIVEVMTDKATVEIPAPAAGTVTALHAKPGEVVPVGHVLFSLDEGGGSARGGASAKPAAARAGAAPGGGASAPVATAATRTIEFKLPDIGEGVAEGEIVRWLVAEGAEVAEHQPVVEVMTDKATVEIPAPAAGRVSAFLAAEGQTVPVGQAIFRLEAGASAAGVRAASAPAAAAAPKAKAEARPAAAPVPAPAALPAPAIDEADELATPDGNGKVLAVPSARRVARELGIDLTRVSGSGRNGVIRRSDVEAFHARGEKPAPAAAPAAPRAATAAPAPARAPQPGEVRRVPFRGVRRKIADAMARSKQTAAHFTVVEEIDVTALVALRAKAKQIGAEEGVNVTYMPFIMKAAALGLARFPMLNGHLDEAAQEIVLPSSVNLGIATDTPTGLLVPVVRDVQAKGVLQLAAELGDLAERTRTGKVRPDELKGSTFSITNAGNLGGIIATPIINFPDIAILGVHRLMKKPGVVETPEGDRIEVRQYMNFSVSVDHRLADGADAVRFLMHFKRLLEDPGLMAL